MLVIGNSMDGKMPARANMRMFRVGDRRLSSYEFDTMDLSKLKPGAERSKHIEVDEVKRFFDRAGKGDGTPPAITDPRMTTGAFMFITMDRDEDYMGRHDDRFRQKAFRRHGDGSMLAWPGNGYRTYGDQDAGLESTGLSFEIRQMEHSASAYMDNARFEVSHILWEFSPDGGRGRWYQLYELPNRDYMRITLPEPTNQIRARAISSDKDEWVQAMAVSTRVDYQNAFASELRWHEDSPGSGSRFEVDDFGFITWDRAEGGNGDIVYALFAESDEFDPVEIARTRGWSLSPDDYSLPEGSTRLRVDALDVSNGRISKKVQLG